MPLEEEMVKGYDAFKTRLEHLKKSHQKLFILFTGSKDLEGRRSWCPDCNDLEEILTNFKETHKPVGFLLRVDVGGRAEWKAKDCPFRTDKATKLQSIPTLMAWGTPKRLAGEAILNEENLLMVFFDED